MLRIGRRIQRGFTQASSFANHMDNFLSSDNALYAEQMFENWKKNRSSVHASWDAYFTNLSNGVESNQAFIQPPRPQSAVGSSAHHATPDHSTHKKHGGETTSHVAQEKLAQMILRYRRRAHELANIDPLNIEENRITNRSKFITLEQDPREFGFSPAEIQKPIHYYSNMKGFSHSKKEWTPLEVSKLLQEIYSGPITYEYSHIPNNEVQDWIRERIENVPPFTLSKQEKTNLLDRILRSQAFTDFCEKKYSSAKRFGIDGLDSAISGMEMLVNTAKKEGVQHIIVGMAHRGRLNTLACVFEKPYEAIFTEFKDPGIAKNIKSADWGFAGDVKYHLGASHQRHYEDGSKISLTMLPNPSHLETVNTVALGKAKSKMDHIGDKEGDKVVPVLIHGDAAFAGQGVVYETLQMELLKGYTCKGTVHIVFNNHVGFTTNPRDGRSTPYCTDVMKANNSFIIHVNADYPEQVDWAFKLAIEYRMKFKRDVVVDVSGYRKFGHNEQDMPKFTQPKSYERVEKMTPMWKKYAAEIVKSGEFTQEEIDARYNFHMEKMDQAFEKAKHENFNHKDWDSSTWKGILSPALKGEDHRSPVTKISEDQFKTIGRKINTLPTKNFHPIIQKVYEQRLKAVETGQGLDWAGAEALAFASLLIEGFGVRLSGEDVRRGTFSHRHACIIDQKDYFKYYPIRSVLTQDQEIKFQCFNSLLSEYGVLGFDYGYSIGNPNYLTIWEAQFGDFSNVAQPVIDQYIAGGERKWGVKSGLTLLLPHGYDGQGPEHSSARLERFLQLLDDDPYDPHFFESSAEKQTKLANMTICNITEPANYFHVLRRQLHRTTYRKPLIILSPKRLLRLKEAKSDMKDFTETPKFREVIGEATPNAIDEPKKIKQLIFCSGQIYYDLVEKRTQLGRKVAFLLTFRTLLSLELNRSPLYHTKP
jgi:2-oxoglutarate dehydrogenase E1 component